MTDNLDGLIKEIVDTHNIALGKDDPLMILMTVNQRLLTDFNDVLRENLTSLQGALKLNAQQWDEKAEARAEKILTLALNSSREHIADVMKSGAAGLSQTVLQELRAEISRQLAEPVKKTHALLQLTLVAAGTALLASAAALWMVFQR